jgi:hypothetical protein
MKIRNTIATLAMLAFSATPVLALEYVTPADMTPRDMSNALLILRGEEARLQQQMRAAQEWRLNPDPAARAAIARIAAGTAGPEDQVWVAKLQVVEIIEGQLRDVQTSIQVFEGILRRAEAAAALRPPGIDSSWGPSQPGHAGQSLEAYPEPMPGDSQGGHSAPGHSGTGHGGSGHPGSGHSQPGHSNSGGHAAPGGHTPGGHPQSGGGGHHPDR